MPLHVEERPVTEVRGGILFRENLGQQGIDEKDPVEGPIRAAVLAESQLNETSIPGEDDPVVCSLGGDHALLTRLQADGLRCLDASEV
jgi:hypothetical protein